MVDFVEATGGTIVMMLARLACAKVSVREHMVLGHWAEDQLELPDASLDGLQTGLGSQT